MKSTLIEAFLLVFLVVFIFAGFPFHINSCYCGPGLHRRDVLLLGLFGYSINLLTLFALVLAIGIVVDDAIVVVEAVHAKIDQGKKMPKGHLGGHA